MPKNVKTTDFNGNSYTVDVEDLVWRPSAYAIIIKDDKILLTKQRGSFHLPGGGVEKGETPEEAVVREVKEETGLVVANPKFVNMLSGFFSWHEKKIDKLHHFQTVLLFFSCDYKSGDISTDGFDYEEINYGEPAEWVRVSDLSKIKNGSTFDWQAVVEKYLKLDKR